ncbi:MAG: type I methionyl aminopeptidase [Deltaproteobacteria bacterium]
MIPRKTRKELDIMAGLGRLLAGVMDDLEAMIAVGLPTRELDARAADLIQARGVRSAFKGYRGYPANICVSLNEEVVHGIPGRRALRQGDIVSIDIGIEGEGFFSDMAKTFAVGRVPEGKQRLIDVTRECLEAAMAALGPGENLSCVGRAVQGHAEANGFSVVRDFVGHGIGKALHEEPQIPNFLTKDAGPILEEGMVLAVEPMISAGRPDVLVLRDGWTAVTRDGSPAAHFEHTIAITNKGAEVLTQKAHG